MGLALYLPVESPMDPTSLLHSAKGVCESSPPMVLAVQHATLVALALNTICLANGNPIDFCKNNAGSYLPDVVLDERLS
jgi:hypothetical protein